MNTFYPTEQLKKILRIDWLSKAVDLLVRMSREEIKFQKMPGPTGLIFLLKDSGSEVL